MDYTNTQCSSAQTETPVATVPTRVAEYAYKTYADKITANWQKASNGIYEVAALCHKANKELSAVDKKKLFEQLPFDRTVFSKLAKIGGNPRIHCPEVEKLLPANYSLQYELTKLEPEELEEAIAQGYVNPRARRADLLKWVKSQRAAEGIGRAKIKRPESQWAGEGYETELEKRDEDRLLDVLKRLWNSATELTKRWGRADRRLRERFVTEVLKVKIEV